MHDLDSLRERAKELRCLYAIDAIVADYAATPTTVFMRVIDAIPPGWQYPASTGACVEYLGRVYAGVGYRADARSMVEPITLWGTEVGRIRVTDTDADALREQRPFLAGEVELLGLVARRVGDYLERKHAELLGERTGPTREHWTWRQHFAEALASRVDAARFGVTGMFLGGSTARGDAGPASDIDLYVVLDGTDEQRRAFEHWVDGWSLCLAEVAHRQTGQPFPDGVINLHWLSAAPGMWQRAELQALQLDPPEVHNQ